MIFKNHKMYPFSLRVNNSIKTKGEEDNEENWQFCYRIDYYNGGVFI